MSLVKFRFARQGKMCVWNGQGRIKYFDVGVGGRVFSNVCHTLFGEMDGKREDTTRVTGRKDCLVRTTTAKFTGNLAALTAGTESGRRQPAHRAWLLTAQLVVRG